MRWAIPGLSDPKRRPPQRIWSGHQYRAVSCCILLTLLRSVHHYKCFFFLCFYVRHCVLLLVTVFSICLCVQHWAPHSCWCGALLWGGIWLHDPKDGHHQHPKLWVQHLHAWSVLLQAQRPQIWMDQSRVQILVHWLFLVMQINSSWNTVGTYPLLSIQHKFKLHPFSGLWRCVWTMAMRWSSLVLEKPHRANRRQLGSVPRSVCFTSSGGEIAARRCSSAMQRICFHIHW